MRYDAFISYNHAADGDLAPALQDALQHLAKPWYRRRSMTVFRDETNLSASPELFGAITDALDESRYYVLLASPGSAQSEWVGREITYWTRTKTAASLRLLVVLTDGALRWDDTHQCFDAQASTAMHPELQHVFAQDPLYMDLSDAHAAIASGAVNQGRDFRRLFRHPVAKVGARIAGVEVDALEGEDLKQHRRTLRVAWGAAVALVLLAVAAVLGLLSAQSNARKARDQAQVAQSGELAGRASAQLQTNTPLAMALAVAADRRAESSLARSALSSAAAAPVTAVFGRGTSGDRTGVQASAVSPDGRRVATVAGDSHVAVWDIATGKRVADLSAPETAGVLDMAFSPDGRRLAVAYQRRVEMAPESDVPRTEGRNVVFDVDTHTPIETWDDANAWLNSVTFSPDGTTVAAGDTMGHLVTWRPEDSDRTPTPTSTPTSTESAAVSSVAFSPDGQRLVTGVSNRDSTITIGIGRVQGWDAVTMAPVGAQLNVTDVSALAYSPKGDTIAIGGESGRILLCDATSGKIVKSFEDPTTVVHLAFNPTGGLLASGDSNGNVVVRDTQTEATVAAWNAGTKVTSVAFTTDGRTLATGDDLGHVVVRDTSALTTRAATGSAVLSLTFIGDGRDVLAATSSGAGSGGRTAVERWNPADGSPVRIDNRDTTILAALSPDGHRFASSVRVGADGTPGVTIIDVESRAVIDVLDTAAVPLALTDDDALVLGDGDRLEAVDLAKAPVEPTPSSGPTVRPQTISTYQPGPKAAVGPRGTIVTVDQGGASTAWSADGHAVKLTGRTLALTSDTAVFSPDGRTVASLDGRFAGNRRTVHLWNVSTRRSIALQCGSGSRPTVVAFDPRGGRIAIGRADGGVTLCDIAADRVLATWAASGRVTSLAFSTDGTQVAAGDETGHMERWDAWASTARSSALRARVCGALRGYRPTDAEWRNASPGLAYSDLCPN